MPETAVRGSAGYEKFHTGRGGEGNIHRERGEKEGLAEKLKEKVLGKKPE